MVESRSISWIKVSEYLELTYKFGQDQWIHLNKVTLSSSEQETFGTIMLS